jgi:hypothetical protein
MENYRQYSITTNKDIENINNGRCPDYALLWNNNLNVKHWPKGHDYFIGNGKDINNNELRKILSEKLKRGTLKNKILFCDLDGVLANFEEGFKLKFNKSPNDLSKPVMWSIINKSKTFFENLPWMLKGREFWNAIKKYDPIILTGVPPNLKTAEEQKRKWCARELGSDIHVITCSSKNKSKYCISDSILIDDRTENQNKWIYSGGIFILYNEDNIDNIIEEIEQNLD